jgi:hypothetical protein
MPGGESAAHEHAITLCKRIKRNIQLHASHNSQCIIEASEKGASNNRAAMLYLRAHRADAESQVTSFPSWPAHRSRIIIISPSWSSKVLVCGTCNPTRLFTTADPVRFCVHKAYAGSS